MGVGIAHQRNFIAQLQHRVAVGTGQNAVAADTFDIATRLAVDAQLAQIFPSARATSSGPTR